jgi:hypothetical protein
MIITAVKAIKQRVLDGLFLCLGGKWREKQVVTKKK